MCYNIIWFLSLFLLLKYSQSDYCTVTKNFQRVLKTWLFYLSSASTLKHLGCLNSELVRKTDDKAKNKYTEAK